MSLQVNDRMLWPEGRKKAFTLSYDDGITQDIKLIELLNKYGVKATFNLNAGLFGQKGTVAAGRKEVPHIKIEKDKITTVYKGHEIAVHGQYHKCLVGMDAARCVDEILECRKELEKLTGRTVTGFAYAFGVFDKVVLQALESCGISYARTVESTHNFDIPQNFMIWNPTCHHDDDKIFELADEFLSDKIYFSFYTPAKLFYVWGHSYEFDQNDNWDHIEKFIRKIAGRDDVWYATNGEIREYVEAYKRLIYSADGNFAYNPSAIPVYLGGTFTDEYIEILPGQTQKLLEPINV